AIDWKRRVASPGRGRGWSSPPLRFVQRIASEVAGMVRLDRVVKQYPGGGRAVDGVSLTVQPGEFVCLIGPSGCGKTTTLKLINRLLEPDQGTVYIDGKDVRQMDPVSLRRQIGYVIQQIG